MSHEAYFFEVMRTRLVGEQVSGSSVFAHLCRLRAEYYEIYVLPTLATCVDDALTLCPDFREELFEKLLAFFEPRLSVIGSLEPTSVPQNQEKCFGGNVAGLGVGLAYPTRDFFYAKMPRTFQDLTITIGDLNLAFDASALAVQPPREKWAIAYELADVDQENNVRIRAALAERGQKDTTKGIGQQLRGAGVDLPEDALRRAIAVFERQGDADFFLPKDAVTFLQDQLDHWLAPHAFASEVPIEEHILHIAVLRSVALNLIAAIDHFEDQLVQAWTKPKAVVTAHYVITLDKLAAADPTLKIIQQLIHHANFPAQVTEWRTLGIIDDTYSSEDVVIATEIGPNLNERYAHLPADTQYFPALEPVLASLFPELDQSLDGWLVKSENFQALCTLLPQFQGAVTAIYIDPPFNKGGPAGTRKASGKGGDGDFAYSVNYQAASWVTLLANRLELAREFLGPAGSIFVRCGVDGNMYVRMLLDEIFGAENFRNEIVVRRAEASKGEFMKQFDAMRSMTVNYDNLYWYSRDPTMRLPVITKLATAEQQPARWHSFWKAQHRPHLRYELLGVTPPRGQWMWKEERALAAVANYNNYIGESEGTGESLENYWRRTGECLEFVKYEGRSVGAVKYWIPPRETVVADNNWLDVKGYANTWRFKTENSEALLRRVILGSSSPSDLVMDFFLGSGTTVAVAHKLGRRWLGVEVGPHLEGTILPRLKEVLAGRGRREPCEISKESGWTGGGFFQYCTLATFDEALQQISIEDLVDYL